jgi:predicted HTH domain antitoxin
MALVIEDELVRQTGLTEPELRIEIACRLFAAGKLYLPQATRLSGLSRPAFEAELVVRDLPLVLYDEALFRRDLDALNSWERPPGVGR